MAAACWSPALPVIGVSPAKQRRGGERTGAIDDLGQDGAGYAEQRAQAVVPPAGRKVHQQGARGVGRIGNMGVPRRQFPDQPAFDRSGEQPSVGERRRHVGPVGERPHDLGAREIGIEQQPGFRLYRHFMAGGLHCGAGIGGAPVLPGRWQARAGSPVRRSQNTTVSRWLVIPMAAMFAAPTVSATSIRQSRLARQISAASCSTQPGRG